MGVSKGFKAKTNYTKDPDAKVLERGRNVQDSTFKNVRFPSTPVSFEDFKEALDRFAELIAEAIHGDRRVIAQKNKVRQEVIRKLELVGTYVSVVAENDEAAFKSSGFENIPTNKTEPQPLEIPGVAKIKQGYSGELIIKIKTVGRGASHYDLRQATVDGDGTPGPWTETTITQGIRYGVHVTGLNPGRTYAFQVRALGKTGYTDWSDSCLKMCT
jgi:hypothetical protein